MNFLQKYKDDIINNNNTYFYKLLLHINEEIWNYKELIKSLSKDYQNNFMIAEISNNIFENQKKILRLKNYFNILEKSHIQQENSSQNNVCFIKINDEYTIYNKLSEINYICISHDHIYIDDKYKKIITKIFVNPNILFVESNDNYSTIYDLHLFKINSNLIHIYEFDPISYNSGGLFGDFINQLSVIAEKFYDTGRKGLLYISNDGDAFRNGIEFTYNDTYNIIINLIYIKSYNIFNNEKIDINLSNWRNNLANNYNLYKIFNYTYNINWGNHKWLNCNNDNKWSDKILINISPYRSFSPSSLSLFKEHIKQNLSHCVFISNEKEWYEDFVIKTGFNIDYYQLTSFDETLTIVNSCKIGYFGYSSIASIAIALHKEVILLNSINIYDYNMCNLKGDIPYILDIFK